MFLFVHVFALFVVTFCSSVLAIVLCVVHAVKPECMEQYIKEL